MKTNEMKAKLMAKVEAMSDEAETAYLWGRDDLKCKREALKVLMELANECGWDGEAWKAKEAGEAKAQRRTGY